MKLFLTLLSSFLISSALAENAQSKAFMAEDAIDHSARIVGGTEVTPHSYPFVVALIVDFGSLNLLCQGCIISNMMVLTTGKCIDNSISTQVIAGAHDMTRIEPEQRRQTIFSQQYRVHPNYTTNWFHYDIALILLTDPIVPNQYIQIIALPELQPEPQEYAGELATIFGFSPNSGTRRGMLHSTQNMVLSNAECSTMMGNVSPNNICLSTFGARGPCWDDEGGPMVIQSFDMSFKVIGVFSTLHTLECDIGNPARYARVTSHLEWIAENWMEAVPV